MTKFYLRLVWVIIVIIDTILLSNAHYTQQWAVHIPGGFQVADQVARDHGFNNHGTANSSFKKSRLTYKEEDNLLLLNEVLTNNPYINPAIWDAIREQILSVTGKDFSIKSLKDHVDLLINAWMQKDKIMKPKSGIEEFYTEKDKLCQQVYELMQEFRNDSKGKYNKFKTQTKTVNMGIENRNRCAEMLLLKKYNKNNPPNNHNENVFDHPYSRCEEEIIDNKTNADNKLLNKMIKINKNNLAPILHTKSNLDMASSLLMNTYPKNNQGNVILMASNNATESPNRTLIKIKSRNIAETEAKTITQENVEKVESPLGYVGTSILNLPNQIAEIGYTEKSTASSNQNSTPNRLQQNKYNVLSRNKTRIRKKSLQRQGLEYLENYDRAESDFRKKEQLLEERKVQLEAEKLAVEKQRLDLEEKKFVLKEYETKKTLDMAEERFKELSSVIKNQEKLINLIVNKIQ